jgi:ADP-ribose pyrophosphatase YjhB (NUDIX family)
MEIVTIGGCCVVKDSKILLLMQSGVDKKNQAGTWGPPAGHGEGTESLAETAIRETKEECNLDVKLTGIVQAGLYKASDSKNYLIVFYSCEVKDLSQLKVDNTENTDFKWVTSGELKSGKVKLRHTILLPILIKSLENPGFPLETFEDKTILV